jgi:hypothetical protein
MVQVFGLALFGLQYYRPIGTSLTVRHMMCITGIGMTSVPSSKGRILQ